MRQRPDGTFPGLQTREQALNLRTPLEAFLARPDGAAHDYLTDCLVHDREIEPARAPEPVAGKSRDRELVETEG